MKKFLLSLLFAISISNVVSAADKPKPNVTKGSSIGTASVSDASIGRTAATEFAWSSTVNPAKGDASGFDSSFAAFAKEDSAWTFLGTSNNNSGSIDGTSIAWSYNSQAGTWQVTANSSVMVDLVLAVHAGSESGAWLFDNLVLAGGTSQAGSFAINWTNNGGQTPGFSNFSLFARDVASASAVVSPVPEPQTYALMLAALGLITYVKRRKSS